MEMVIHFLGVGVSLCMARRGLFWWFPRRVKIVENKIGWVGCFMVVFSCIFRHMGYQGDIISNCRSYFDLRYCS